MVQHSSDFLEMAGYTVTTDQEAESLDVQYRSLDRYV